MKISKFLAAAAIVLAACGTPYQATDTVVYDAPYGIRTHFVTQYPDATNVVWSRYDPTIVSVVDWELNGWQPLHETDHTVRFTLANDEYYAWYDDRGEWVGTAWVVRDYQLMPAMVNSTLTTLYPGYSVTAVNKQFRGDMVAYEVELKNNDTKVRLLMDSNGNIIKQRSKALY